MRRPLAAVLVLSLCTLVSAPAAGAAARAPKPAPLWQLLFFQLTGLGPAWAKIGCRADPNGLCLPGAVNPGSNREIGCSMDPNGLCLSGAVSSGSSREIGCSADPNGHCRPPAGATANREIGRSIDPDGLCGPR